MISILNTAGLGSTRNATSTTQDYTVPVGTTVLIFICGAQDGNPHSTSVSYGGQALTKVLPDVNKTLNAMIWYLVNPPTGTNNFVVRISGDTSYLFSMVAYSMGGTDPVNPIGQSYATYGSANSQSIPLTGLKKDSFVFNAATSRMGYSYGFYWSSDQTSLTTIGRTHISKYVMTADGDKAFSHYIGNSLTESRGFTALELIAAPAVKKSNLFFQFLIN